MTIKELASIMSNDTIYTVLIGPDQEVVIGEEDKALMAAFSDVIIEHASVNTANRMVIFPIIDMRRDKV